MNRQQRRAKVAIERREAGNIRLVEQEVSRRLQKQHMNETQTIVTMTWLCPDLREPLIEKLVDRVLLKRGVR